ncbi:MAG TPA: OadG family protein [Candidatus Scatomonas merdigallinarum]|nr:OadG family protein [Candidatus Scatomonas merdigallinarum]
MKKFKKRWTGIFLALACLLSLLTAVPVQAAELSENVAAQLQNEVQMFLMPGGVGDFFNLPEESYDQIRESGGFYEVAVDAWRDVRDETGDVVSLGETSVELQEDTGMVQCTTPVEFERYSGEVVMSFTSDNYYPSNFVINVEYPLAKSLEDAGINTVTGLIIVFVILFFLCGVIYLIRYVNPEYRGKQKDAGQKPSASPNAVPKSPVREAPGAVPAPAASVPVPADDIELAIVLATAIAAAEEEQPSGDGYVVRSVRKVRNKNWKRV